MSFCIHCGKATLFIDFGRYSDQSGYIPSEYVCICCARPLDHGLCATCLYRPPAKAASEGLRPEPLILPPEHGNTGRRGYINRPVLTKQEIGQRAANIRWRRSRGEVV